MIVLSLSLFICSGTWIYEPHSHIVPGDTAPAAAPERHPEQWCQHPQRHRVAAGAQWIHAENTARYSTSQVRRGEEQDEGVGGWGEKGRREWRGEERSDIMQSLQPDTVQASRGEGSGVAKKEGEERGAVRGKGHEERGVEDKQGG